MLIYVQVCMGLIGAILVLIFLRSVFHVALINRRTGDWLAYRVASAVYSTLAFIALRRSSYAGIQDVLAWVLPLYILLLIVVWFSLVQLGFSLIIWSLHAEYRPLEALIASGSALSTLGFLTPPSLAGQFLAILEGAMGLGVVVFYFTFIPGYQSSVQLRQAKVAWLYARRPAGLSNFTLVEYSVHCGPVEWSGLWEAWEYWFRNIAETHVLAPILCFVPTVHRGQTWLAAAAVALDSVSFYLSALDEPGKPAAIVCHATGVEALRLIAAELPPRTRQQDSTACRPIERHDFDMACENLTAAGAKVVPDVDGRWSRFVQLRGEYEMSLLRLAGSLLVPGYDKLFLPIEANVETPLERQSAHPVSNLASSKATRRNIPRWCDLGAVRLMMLQSKHGQKADADSKSGILISEPQSNFGVASHIETASVAKDGVTVGADDLWSESITDGCAHETDMNNGKEI